MLTRAKKGMVIVSKKSFIKQAQQTLVGRLADQWSSRTRRVREDGKSSDPYDADVWVYFRDVTEGRADLPGVEGQKEKLTDLKMPVEVVVSPDPGSFETSHSCIPFIVPSLPQFQMGSTLRRGSRKAFHPCSTVLRQAYHSNHSGTSAQRNIKAA